MELLIISVKMPSIGTIRKLTPYMNDAELQQLRQAELEHRCELELGGHRLRVDQLGQRLTEVQAAVLAKIGTLSPLLGRWVHLTRSHSC
jgi:hypothetical protein